MHAAMKSATVFIIAVHAPPGGIVAVELSINVLE
jgi:hypothetical protein